MKGIIGNQKGVLIPYQKFCDEVGLPKGYILKNINQGSEEYVYFEIVGEDSYELKDGMITLFEQKKMICIRRTREEVNKIIGIKLEKTHFSICLKGKEDVITRLNYGGDVELKWSLTEKKDNIYVWASTPGNFCFDEEEYFVETER